MSYPLPGVYVNPNGTTQSVTITDDKGNTPTVYSDPLGQNVVALPKSISSPFTFYLPSPGTWTVAGVTLSLEGSEVATVTQSGASVSTGALASRPAATGSKALYYATDTNTLYVDAAAGTWDSASGTAAPNPPKTVTANHQMVALDSLVLVDTTSGAVTVTLPTSPSYGVPYAVMRSAGTNAVTVAPGAGVVNGVGSITYTDEVVLYVFDGTNWNSLPYTLSGASGGGGGGSLAIVQYDPASAVNHSVTSTTLTAVDSTNLTVTFTAPTSGRVLVRLSCLAGVGATASPLGWGMLDHTTGNLYGPVGYPAQTANGAFCMTVALVISGLTSGTSYSMDWAAGLQTGSTAATMYYGGTNATTGWGSGPAVIEVWSA